MEYVLTALDLPVRLALIMAAAWCLKVIYREHALNREEARMRNRYASKPLYETTCEKCGTRIMGTDQLKVWQGYAQHNEKSHQ